MPPEWLLAADVSDRAIRIYCLLEHHWRPTRGYLAELARCSIDSVDRALVELVSVGALLKGGRRGAASVYEFKPEGAAPVPQGRTRAATHRVDKPEAAAPVRLQIPGLARARDSEENLKPREIAKAISRPTPEKQPRKPRARDPIWDTLVDLIGASPAGLERGRWNAAVKSLKESGATPETMRAAATIYRTHPSFAQCILTPTALATNWAVLQGAGNGHVNGESPEALSARLAEIDRAWYPDGKEMPT